MGDHEPSATFQYIHPAARSPGGSVGRRFRSLDTGSQLRVHFQQPSSPKPVFTAPRPGRSAWRVGGQSQAMAAGSKDVHLGRHLGPTEVSRNIPRCNPPIAGRQRLAEPRGTSPRHTIQHHHAQQKLHIHVSQLYEADRCSSRCRPLRRTERPRPGESGRGNVRWRVQGEAGRYKPAGANREEVVRSDPPAADRRHRARSTSHTT